MAAHDPHKRLNERAADDSSAEKGAGTFSMVQRMMQAAISDEDRRDVFESAVREFTVAARRNGDTVERMIVALKQELAAVPQVDRKLSVELVAFAVKTSIDEYYHPTTSEFPST